MSAAISLGLFFVLVVIGAFFFDEDDWGENKGENHGKQGSSD